MSISSNTDELSRDITMSIRAPIQLLLACAAVAISLAIALPAHAAGSSSGGSTPSYSANSRSLTPEQLSAKAFRAGLKHRDLALKHEAKAARAKSDKARDKLVAKAHKQYAKAIEKQSEALKYFPENYKAANEMGFALRKTGDFRKAIGAYTYALDINPNFHEATEYRGEAFLALGLFDQAKQSYMVLFRNDRGLADQLMATIDTWIEAQDGTLEPAAQDFVQWVNERKRMAKITADLSMNNTRSW